MHTHKYKFITLLIISYYLFNNFLLQSMIIGTYENVNYKDSPIILNSPDILSLIEDNTFYSEVLGYGNYKISYMITGTKIRFSGKENMVLHVNRTWYGNPKINVFFDLNHHYKRTSSEGRISLETKKRAIKRAEEEKKRTKEIQKNIQEEMYK